MQPGDFGLCYSSKSWIIALLQCLIGDVSRYTHAFIVLDEETAIEASMHKGVVRRPLTEYKNVIYVHSNLTDEQREIIIRQAQSCIGAKYGWMNYICIGLMRLGRCPGWLVNKIASSNKFICSQLVCHAYETAGVQLIGHPWNSLNVTPGRLSYILGANNA